mmetsp:Transcript_8304/g.36738  ORF Transcript_8304/g.36738 Transcript_8304/m.36738 type:complete len:208 (+) Transcript_8304:1289-1912(+)
MRHVNLPGFHPAPQLVAARPLHLDRVEHAHVVDASPVTHPAHGPNLGRADSNRRVIRSTARFTSSHGVGDVRPRAVLQARDLRHRGVQRRVPPRRAREGRPADGLGEVRESVGGGPRGSAERSAPRGRGRGPRGGTVLLASVVSPVEPRELRLGVHPGGGDGLRGGFRHLPHPFLVPVVGHQVVPVRVLVLDAADVHPHRVDGAQGP